MESLEKQLEVIKRGTLEILPEEELVPKLKKSIETGKPLRVKLGIDPTSPIFIWLYRCHSQDAAVSGYGHLPVLIIGDYTATVGDPSGKNKTRQMFSHEEVLKNAKTYQDQFFRIVDKNRCEVIYNGDWFKKLTSPRSFILQAILPLRRCSSVKISRNATLPASPSASMNSCIRSCRGTTPW